MAKSKKLAIRPDNSGEKKDYRQVALGLLARREHAARELIIKLVGRGMPESEAEGLVNELARRGLQSETRFVEEFVRSRIRRGAGPVKICVELRERGVESALIKAGLTGSGTNWAANAAEARERKFGATVPGEFANRARQARFLQNRGFTAEQIRKAMNFDFEDA